MQSGRNDRKRIRSSRLCFERSCSCTRHQRNRSTRSCSRNPPCIIVLPTIHKTEENQFGFSRFFMKNRGCIYPIFVVQLMCGKGSRPGKRQVEVALRKANNAASAKKLLLQRRKSVFLTCRVFCLRKIQQTISDRTAAPQIKKCRRKRRQRGKYAY